MRARFSAGGARRVDRRKRDLHVAGGEAVEILRGDGIVAEFGDVEGVDRAAMERLVKVNEPVRARLSARQESGAGS